MLMKCKSCLFALKRFQNSEEGFDVLVGARMMANKGLKEGGYQATSNRQLHL